MVRRASSGRVNYADYGGGDDDGEEYSSPDEDHAPPAKKRGRPPKKTSGGRVAKKAKKKGPRGKISPSKTPASKRRNPPPSRASGRARNDVSYADDESDEADDDEDDDESDGEYTVASKKTPHSGGGGRAKGRNKPGPKSRKRPRYDDDSAEEEEEEDESEEDEEEEEEEEDSDDDDYRRRPKTSPKKKKGPGGRGGSSSLKLKIKTPKKREVEEPIPPVKVMVIESIRALKDPPRKGSTLGSIKETIALNWPVDMKRYDNKIKKFISGALASGILIQPKSKKSKATGFRGRFTIPGMKVKRRKKKRRKESDDEVGEDAGEYKPARTSRDDERERHEEELERRRLERRMWAEERAAEKASKPKPKPRPKKKEWEVEAIKGRKVVRGETFYLVKFEGYAKPQWEPEENVDGCIYVDEFLQDEAVRRIEEEDKRRRQEADGNYEVRRIMDVNFLKNGKREFLIRWAGCTADDDTWEPEYNLDCEDLIDKYMAQVDKARAVSQKELRVAPARTQRLEFASTNRGGKRRGAFRITYEGMED